VSAAAAKAAGTPGPWFVDRRDADIDGVIEILAIEKGGAIIVAEVACEAGAVTERERADARKIAAAPEAVELAQAVLKYFGDDPIPNHLNGDRELRDAARAIIAKVES
jgi:hypothetical protein